MYIISRWYGITYCKFGSDINDSPHKILTNIMVKLLSFSILVFLVSNLVLNSYDHNFLCSGSHNRNEVEILFNDMFYRQAEPVKLLTIFIG